MIVIENIEIVVNNHNLQHYKNLGYDAKCRKKLTIKTNELTHS